VVAVDVNALRKRFAGELFAPSDPGYDDARAVWNGVIDRHPWAIARCGRASEVADAIRFGREHGLTIGVRGGGHNVAGTGVVDGGLLIDLSSMRGVEVDPAARRAIVQGGATLGDVDAATQVHGLAAAFGVVSETGVAGLTLSGGIGWLRRLHGMSCDGMLAAEVVTAEGEIVRASEDERPELLWALRGGGGNFGVVTSFEFALHEIGPEVAVAFVLYEAADGLRVFQGVQELLAAEPERFAPLGFYGIVPADEAFPEHAHGAPFAAVAGVYPSTDPSEGERAIAPYREFAEPIADLSGTMPYVEAQALLDEEYPNGRRYYWKSTELSGLSDDALSALARLAGEAPSPLSTLDIWFQGGAMARVPADATAYGDRSAPILIGVEANWEGADADEVNIGWGRRCIDELAPFSTGGVYMNFPGFHEEEEQQLRAAFGANYDRLVEVKTAYDPDNVFRVNHNIVPAG
jgi:FAD/FMN-containing dehydrogenase